MIERLALDQLEEEAALAALLDLLEAGRAGTDQQACHLRVHLDAESLAARAERKLTQAPLEIDGGRALRVDDAVTVADGAALGQDLARTVGDVLARHLHQPER